MPFPKRPPNKQMAHLVTMVTRNRRICQMTRVQMEDRLGRLLELQVSHGMKNIGSFLTAKIHMVYSKSIALIKASLVAHSSEFKSFKLSQSYRMSGNHCRLASKLHKPVIAVTF